MSPKWRWIAIAVVLVLGIGGSLVSGPPRRKEAIEKSKPESFGPEDAPVHIVARYPRPSTEADTTLRMLQKITDEYDPNISVTFMSDNSVDDGPDGPPEGVPERSSMLINGRDEFSRIISGELTTVHFSGPPHPEGSQWREADLHAFLKTEFDRLGISSLCCEREFKRTSEGQTTAIGDRHALVQIAAYYPMTEGCVKDTIAMLKETVEKHEGDVFLELIDTCSDDGYTGWTQTKLVCFGIKINGRQEYEVETDGETEKVVFYGPMDTEWSREQFEAALEGEIARCAAEE